MAKIRVAISIDEDVLRFIDGLAKADREERSRFINRHFAAMMPKDDPAPAAEHAPVKRKGKAQA